jgi:hypothetical protein
MSIACVLLLIVLVFCVVFLREKIAYNKGYRQAAQEAMVWRPSEESPPEKESGVP